MKPEQWIIEDIGRLRKKVDKTEDEQQYLNLLVWYVQQSIPMTESQRKMMKVASQRGKELEPSGPLAGSNS